MKQEQHIAPPAVEGAAGGCGRMTEEAQEEEKRPLSEKGWLPAAAVCLNAGLKGTVLAAVSGPGVPPMENGGGPGMPGRTAGGKPGMPEKGPIVYLTVKRCFDVVFSLVCLVLFSPVFLIIALLIHGADHGPAIHRRRCVSATGTYDMLKFRTMVADADDLEKYLTPEQIVEYRENIKLKDDPRITRIGSFLRKTSLDELPQLMNVLRGEMSVVGPRPVTQEELVYFGADAPTLLAARPGITGYWQVSGRSDCTYESGARQRLELYYVEHRGLRLDVHILLRTIPAVLSARGSL